MGNASPDAENAAEIIEMIISAYTLDQDDFNEVMEKIANNHAESLLDWIQNSTGIKGFEPGETESVDDLELEWI